jgi:hypothetical protein
MMEQALSSRLQEDNLPIAPAAPVAGAAAQPKPAAPGTANKDPKVDAAIKKSAAGQTLNPEEQKLVAGAAMMAAESRLRRVMKRLNESEVQQAQVVLAAQDMVDKMQGMIEDTTEMQFKELPALVESIKNQIGADQAAQFNNDAQAALTGLVQNLQGSKQQLEQALGVVTGQGPVEMPGAEMAPPPPAGEEQIDVSMTAPSPEEQLDAAAVGPAASLGRERR